MRHFISHLVVIFIFALFMANASANRMSIEGFAKQPDIYGPSLSPDGKHIAFIVRVETGELKGNAIAVLNVDTKKQKNYSFTNNGKSKYRSVNWLNDKTLMVRIEHQTGKGRFIGFNTRLFKLDIKTGDLDSLVHPYRGYIVDYIDDDPDHFLFATRTRRSRGQAVFLGSVKGDKPLRIQKGINYYHSWMTDQQTRLRLAKSSNVRARNRIVHRGVEGSSFRTLWEFDADSNRKIIPIGFDLDPNILYFKAILDDRWVIYKTDVTDSNLPRTMVYDNPNDEILGDLIYSRSTKQAMGVYKGPGEGYMLWDSAYKNLSQTLDKALPGQDNYFYGFSKNENRLLVYSSSDIESGSYYIWDRAAKSVDLIAFKNNDLPPELLVKQVHSRIVARDGKERPVTFTFPKGGSANKPTLIYLGTEPGYLFRKGFINQSQFLANQGYNVVQLALRDPLDYEEKARDLGVVSWGPDSINDVVDVAREISKLDAVDKHNICILGERYGGTIALTAAASEEFDFKCAISIGGVTDFRKHMKFKRSYNSYWRHKRYVGEKMQYSMKHSPIELADKLKVPVLLAHGEKDKMVEVSQSQNLRDKLEKFNVPITYKEIEGAGHNMDRNNERLELYMTIAGFLDNVMVGNKVGNK